MKEGKKYRGSKRIAGGGEGRKEVNDEGKLLNFLK